MPKARYKSNLPSIHFTEDELVELERVLGRGRSDADVIFVLDSGQLTYEFSSVDEMLNDDTLPTFIQSYEITSETTQGEIRITSDPGDREIELAINGEQSWVKKKVREVEDFFELHGDSIRTLVEEHLIWGLVGLTGLAGVFLYSSGNGEVVGIEELGDVVFYGFIALVLSGILLIVVNYVHPYSIIIVRTNKEFRPYLSRIVKFISVIGGLLAILGFALRIDLIAL